MKRLRCSRPVAAGKRGQRLYWPAACLLLCSPGLAAAESPELTGLKATGVEPALIYDGDLFANPSGGLRRGATYLGTLNLQLTLDGERLVGWPGATFYVDGLSIHGGQPGSFAGDAQGVSNLEGPRIWKLEEAWWQQNLFGNRVSLLAGLYDLSTEFYRAAASALLLNNSFSTGPEFSQSGHWGPSIYPNPAFGARLALKPARGVVLRTAVFDDRSFGEPFKTYAAPEHGHGVLLISEAALLLRPEPEGRPLNQRFRLGRRAGLPPYTLKLAAGGWYYSATFGDPGRIEAPGEPVRHRGDSGFYLLADGVIFQSPETPKRRVSAFAKLGFADPQVNRFDSFVGAGLVAKGLLPGRDGDELGLAVAYAGNGSRYLAQQRLQGTPVSHAETTIELTYLLQLNAWLALQPDLQYIVGTDTNPLLGNTLAAQLRFEMSF